MPDHQTLVIRGGTVLDAGGRRRADVAVGDDGVIVAVEPELEGGTRVLDAGGCVVAPGLVDLHAHLREPGDETSETVLTGSRCAAAGGFTAVVAMPNTSPPADDAATVGEILRLGRSALCEVQVAAATTRGRAGEELSPMGELAGLGVRLFTDDGAGVQDPGVMRRALEYAHGLGVTLAQHCEVEALAAGGQMHEGEWSDKLGLPGVPAAAEELMVQRDLLLAELTGATVHFQHLSTARSAELVREAKARGLAVTAEVTTHHLTLTDECCSTFDPTFKVNPPLRTGNDVTELRRALADGTIDAVATDHAPHSAERKERPWDEAPPGMLGLETALALLLTDMDLPLERVLEAMSWAPARIAGLVQRHGGPIQAGRPANLCVIDPETTWTVDPAASWSRSRNTPYSGRHLRGRVRHTVAAGEVVLGDGEVQR